MILPSIRCPKCGAVSHHPEDVASKYCGRCHMFHEDMDIIQTIRDSIGAMDLSELIELGTWEPGLRHGDESTPG